MSISDINQPEDSGSLYKFIHKFNTFICQDINNSFIDLDF